MATLQKPFISTIRNHSRRVGIHADLADYRTIPYDGIHADLAHHRTISYDRIHANRFYSPLNRSSNPLRRWVRNCTARRNTPSSLYNVSCLRARVIAV